MADFSRSVRAVVASIPQGRVASYGGVAALAGSPGAARAVGSVLSALDAHTDLPWWRVVGSGGRITTRKSNRTHRLQRALLESEGVVVEPGGRISWQRYGWEGDGEDGSNASRAIRVE